MIVRPIIFSAAMVRALLDGRKTQTRRLATSPLAKAEPGDLLYVREAFKIVPSSAYRCSEGVTYIVNPNDHDEAAIFAAGWERSIPKWKPSIHLPRWGSRLTLEVTAVKIGPLQDISEADANAEGISASGPLPGHEGDIGAPPHRGADENYALLWDELHGKGAWDKSPEVVALTFRVHKCNVDQMAKE